MADLFRTTRLVEFHDTDMAGIMHFGSFFHYMESAEHELIRSLGYSVHSVVDGKTLSFPRVSATCQFHSPARSEDLLEIGIGVSRIGEKSVTYEFQITHEDRQVATGSMTCVCCRAEPGESLLSVPIPAELAAGLRKFAC